MQNDPIVDEIRKIREQLASEVEYDVRALGRKLQKTQKDSKRKTVSLPAKTSDAPAFIQRNRR